MLLSVDFVFIKITTLSSYFQINLAKSDQLLYDELSLQQVFLLQRGNYLQDIYNPGHL